MGQRRWFLAAVLCAMAILAAGRGFPASAQTCNSSAFSEFSRSTQISQMCTAADYTTVGDAYVDLPEGVVATRFYGASTLTFTATVNTLAVQVLGSVDGTTYPLTVVAEFTVTAGGPTVAKNIIIPTVAAKIQVKPSVAGAHGILKAKWVLTSLPVALGGGAGGPGGPVDLSADVIGDLPYSNLTPATAASRLLGRGSAAGAGDWQPITLGAGLTMTGTSLAGATFTGGAVTTPITFPDGACPAVPSITFTSDVTRGFCYSATGLDIIPPADTVKIHNGATGQSLKLFNTRTDASNGEWLESAWSANVAYLRTAANGTGTARVLQLRYGNNTAVALTVPVSPNTVIELAAGASTTSTWKTQIVGGANVSTGASARGSLLINDAYAPTATSAMIARSFSITPTINYSNGTPGGGSYEAIHVNVTETALPTGQSYLARWQTGGTDRFSVDNLGNARVTGRVNGQNMTVSAVTELTTIAAAATTATTIQIPANAVVYGVSTRVTTVIPTATTFTVTGTTSATAFHVAGGAGISTAAGTTDVGTAAGAYKNGAAQTITLTMVGGVPANTTGRVRVTIHYYELTPPTS